MNAPIWTATNSARVRLPFSFETRRLLDDVRDGWAKAYGGIFTGMMVRALLRGAKTQTSRANPWPVRAGSLVYVRETIGSGDQFYSDHDCDPPEVIVYRADGAADHRGRRVPAWDRWTWNWDRITWRPSIHMPRLAARLLLRMTHNPYQKPIAAFDADDVLREGCPIPSDDPELPGASFDDVWQRIHGEPASSSSAVVWVHRFEVLR